MGQNSERVLTELGEKFLECLFTFEWEKERATETKKK